jgi:PAS domain S-box-containing protein
MSFEALSWKMAFPRGVGLPGRVWATGEPIWVTDIARDPNFPRAAIAGEVGLHGALAFPIKLNTQVLGVLEFFSREIRQPDEDLLQMLGAVGSQIGQFTERKQAEEALRVAYDKIDAILVSLPCAVLIIDQDQRVVYANPLACQHFWPEHGTLAGSVLPDVLPLNQAQWHHLITDLRETTARGRPPQEREFEIRKRIYRYRLFPVTLRDAGPQQAGIVLWDVTEQQQLQDQLIQAEKLSSLGTLVSGMAHEINNPVQGILGMAEIILQESDPDKVKEYAGDIVKYSEHVGSVVRNFACYARPASRDQETDVEFGERLTEAVKLVQRGPQFGHVEVVTEFQPVPRFKAHRTEIDQVFVNLISNAVDAMAGRGRLTLSTHMEGEAITVRISDTGCGIPKAIVGKIFDPFMTTKAPGKGTGLGLSIAHRIVSKYGGRISVESEEGRGTTFTIKFP